MKFPQPTFHLMQVREINTYHISSLRHQLTPCSPDKSYRNCILYISAMQRLGARTLIKTKPKQKKGGRQDLKMRKDSKRVCQTMSRCHAATRRRTLPSSDSSRCTLQAHTHSPAHHHYILHRQHPVSLRSVPRTST